MKKKLVVALLVLLIPLSSFGQDAAVENVKKFFGQYAIKILSSFSTEKEDDVDPYYERGVDGYTLVCKARSSFSEQWQWAEWYLTRNPQQWKTIVEWTFEGIKNSSKAEINSVDWGYIERDISFHLAFFENGRFEKEIEDLYVNYLVEYSIGRNMGYENKALVELNEKYKKDVAAVENEIQILKERRQTVPSLKEKIELRIREEEDNLESLRKKYWEIRAELESEHRNTRWAETNRLKKELSQKIKTLTGTYEFDGIVEKAFEFYRKWRTECVGDNVSFEQFNKNFVDALKAAQKGIKELPYGPVYLEKNPPSFEK